MSKNPTNTCKDASSLPVLPSCLRSRPESIRRNNSFSVSFPEEERNLITGYLEPPNPWEYDNVSREELISSYMSSCEKHGTNPLPVVVEQLKIVDVDAGRNDCFDLRGAPLAALACESLEEVLKRVQFRNINLEFTALDDEGSVALFDMIEYYESATHLNISGNKDIAVRGWQACSRMIKKTRCLEQLEARNVTLNEQYMPILSRALKLGTQLQVLKLENCGLSGRPIIILAAALKLNTGLKELYLADNSLNLTDAAQLGAILRSNQTLQLLDVSNNHIQDIGVGHILDGLIDQVPQCGMSASNGLCVLILWNNHLTRNAAKHLARALAHSTSLEILNVGHNVLTNECLHIVKDSLQQNRTLLRLGMQSTHLTCEGAIALAECIADNPVIQRIDLRDNNLQVAGLMALSLSMKVNRSVNQLDLDYTPKKRLESNEALKQYQSLVTEIRGYCERNEQAEFSEEEANTPENPENIPERTLRVPSSMASRKISLTCETLMRSTDPDNITSSQFLEPKRFPGGRLRSPAPSPVPSPVSSPIPSPSRTRFQVSRVSETHPVGSPSSCSSSPYTPSSISPSPTRFFASPGTSRFRVTLVEPCNSVPPPIVSSPSGNNITVGFTFKLNDRNINTKISPEVNKSTVALPPEDNSSLAVSKLSESLANIEIQEESGREILEKVRIQSSPLPNDSLSTSLTSLDESADSADLEVRQILNLHDNHKSSVLNSEEVKDKETVDSYEQPSKSIDNLPSIPCTKNLSMDTCEEKGVKEDTCNSQIPHSIQNLSGNKVTVPNLDNPVVTLAPNQVSDGQVSKSTKCVNSRQRKISWIAPSNPAPEQKGPTGLEKLLGLFQHPASFFSKSQPQYKATTVIVNQQPVANSNASFLLTAGPLAGAALEARLHGSKAPSPDPLEDEGKEHPVADVLNNNSGDSSGSSSSSEASSGNCSSSSSSSSEAGSNGSDSSPSSSCNSAINKTSQSLNEGKRRVCAQCTVGEKQYVRTRTEDENFNVSKLSQGSESSGTSDKLWCATLSSVCGASVMMSWAHSSSPDSESCDDLSKDTDTRQAILKESPISVLSKEIEEKDVHTSRLYSSVLKNAPSNGMNVPHNSCSLWSSSRDKSEIGASLIPVTNVRLVGGADPCPDDNNSIKNLDGIDEPLPQDTDTNDQLKFLMAEDSKQEASKSAEL